MATRTRTRPPTVEYRRIVQNQSARLAVPRIIVLHTTESRNQAGLSDLKNLGAWFDNPAAQASSHLGIDAEGQSARYVYDSRKAWTQAAYNSLALSIEQVGLMSQSGHMPDAQLREVARWIAWWSIRWAIPIRRAKVSAGSVLLGGVIGHSELGSAGGDHGDPGPDYPWERVLELARWYRKNGWVV